MGDEYTCDYAIALRAVTTTDFMTAEVTMLPPATITIAANRIANEVKHINRVLFDYTTKPIVMSDICMIRRFLLWLM